MKDLDVLQPSRLEIFLSQLLEDQPSDNVTSSDSDWSGEEENDRSRSRSSSTGSHRSHPSPRSTSSGELEATADDSTVSSRSSPNVEQSTSAARPRGRPRRQNAAVPRQQQQEVDNWRQVTTADGGRGTSNRIRFVPTKQPGIQGDLNRDSSVLDCWSTLMTNEILEELVNNINQYAQVKIRMNNPPTKRSRLSNWTDISVPELLKYFAVLIAMGIDKRASLVDYWSQKPYMYTKWYHEIFPRDRFELIHSSMLHCSDTPAQSKEKIEPFVNSLLTTFQGAYYPFENLSLDEMVIGWKGRFRHKTYNACKPKKYHVKTFGLCDSATGYVINVLIYFGAETSYDPEMDPNSDSAIKVFQTLLTPLEPGHHIHADWYYTTRNLIDYLFSEE
ncbi:hypothetical protein RRG08_055512 [Elysia crispata]|uniref:PiggyBac transposable element-derived protein domain-containing protein n=1 Tax=Elysia crispata TaxID=231223 RepID=A0AAE1ARN3_9GAST|nr:hypothetical protein RRG08_055512 [Elysia crispata]